MSRSALAAPQWAGSDQSMRRRLAAVLRRLAPFVVVATLAYPALVWPLLEAELVDLTSAFTPATVDQTPSTLLRAYFTVLFASSCFVFIVQPQRLRLGIAAPLVLLLATYLLWAATTSLWAVEPAISVRRFFLAVFISGSIIGAMLAADDTERTLRLAFWMFTLMVLINIGSVLTTAPTVLGHAGIYPHKNYFAAISSIMMLFAIYQLTNGQGGARLAAAPMLLAGACFLYVAKSKTCSTLVIVTPLLAGGAATLAHYLRISPVISVTAFFLLVFGIYEFGVQSDFWDFAAVAEAIFGDPTLTQRTDIWSFAVKKIAERPWLGYGYEVFWGAGLDSPSVREAPGFVAKMPHAHNGYLDIVLHTGYVGLGIFVVLILATLHLCGRLARHSIGLASFVLSLVIFDLLYNCFETTWFRSFSLKSMIFVLAIALISRSLARERWTKPT
jgi:exopolysaccharide production protein ExoQ